MMYRFEANEVDSRAFTVVDTSEGALVCTRDTAVSAHRIANALTRVVVEGDDLHVYNRAVDSLTPTETRTVIDYLAKLLRAYEEEKDAT